MSGWDFSPEVDLSFLSGLTYEQKKIVYSDCKVNVGLSVPGSGKTTTLVARALRLLAEQNENILICTFSKKATEDIESRLGQDVLKRVHVKTIHSLCFGFLKKYWEDLGSLLGGERWPQEPDIITRIDEINLLTELFPNADSSKMLDSIDKNRSLLISPQQAIRLYKKGIYLNKDRLEDLEKWALYEQERVGRGLLNFDDMVSLVNQILPIPEVSIEMARKYNHILIDEAQDTSEEQWQVLRPIVLGCKTALAVADYNQSIYGWRNADGSVLSNIKNLPGSVTFRLSISFRSGTRIAEAANNVVWDKSSRIQSIKEGGEILVKSFTTHNEEIEYVLDNISKNCAILARTNAYLERFEREVINRKIPYSGTGFYRALHVQEVYNFFLQNTVSDPKAIIRTAFIENAKYSNVEKDDFHLITKIIADNSLQYFQDLVSTSLRYQSKDGLVLSTGHSAKGLEWDRVFVVGAQQGIIPHKLSSDEREENNLFYVMITRARENLTITHIGNPSNLLTKCQLLK